MTDNSSETTEVLPTVEPVVAAADAPAVAPVVHYQPEPTKPAGAGGSSRVMIVVASVVLGLVVLGATFASGAVVGSHFAGGRRGMAVGQQGQLGGPGGMNGGYGQGQRGGRGRRGYGGYNGQMPPQGFGQGQTAPNGQVPPQGQTAPNGSTGQPQ
jgi:hypothetical protein